MCRVLSVLCLMLLLAGCNIPHRVYHSSVVKVETTFDKDVFAKGGRGVVILGAMNTLPSQAQVNNYFTFSNPYYGEFEVVVDNKEKVAAFMLVPGKYVLTNYKLYGYKNIGNGYIYTTLDYKDAYEAEFEVKSGEVLYLGEVNNQVLQSQSYWKTFGQEKFKTASVLTVTDKYKEIPINQQNNYKYWTGKEVKTKLLKMTRRATAEEVKE